MAVIFTAEDVVGAVLAAHQGGARSALFKVASRRAQADRPAAEQALQTALDWIMASRCEVIAAPALREATAGLEEARKERIAREKFIAARSRARGEA